MQRWFSILLICLLPSLAMAQTDARPPSLASPDFDPSTLSDQEILDLLRQIEARRDYPQRTVIMGIPSGFGAPRGFGFVSFAATDRRERVWPGDFDASIALGYGLGNAQTAIGVTPVIEITSTTPSHFGSSGRVGLHFSRNFKLGETWQGAAGLGLQNLLTWGDSSVLDPEWNLSFSSVRRADERLGVPILISAGYGSGVSRFGSDPGFYGGIGVGIHKNFGLSMAWYGDEAITGVNFWPLPERNLLINLGIGDTFNNVSGRRILLTVTLGKRFARRP
jgi:hypothetical protein